MEGRLEVKLPTICTKQRREESKRRREEERRSERRKSEEKEDAGAQKGREVAIHCVFPMISSSGGSKNRDETIAVVAQSTFPSQKAQNTSHSDHFSKLRRRKSARRCGEKQISKSKVLKNDGLRPCLDVGMWKKWTPSRREAHFQVMYKAHQLQTTFGS